MKTSSYRGAAFLRLFIWAIASVLFLSPRAHTGTSTGPCASPPVDCSITGPVRTQTGWTASGFFCGVRANITTYTPAVCKRGTCNVFAGIGITSPTTKTVADPGGVYAEEGAVYTGYVIGKNTKGTLQCFYQLHLGEGKSCDTTSYTEPAPAAGLPLYQIKRVVNEWQITFPTGTFATTDNCAPCCATQSVDWGSQVTYKEGCQCPGDTTSPVWFSACQYMTNAGAWNATSSTVAPVWRQYGGYDSWGNQLDATVPNKFEIWDKRCP